MSRKKCYEGVRFNIITVMRGCQIPRKKRYEGVRFNVITVTRGWVGVKFTEKSVTTVYGSTLLPLRGSGWVSNSQKKALRRCTVQRYYRYEGVGGCQIHREKRYNCVRFNIITVTREWVGVKFPHIKRYEGVRFNVITVTRGLVDVKFTEKSVTTVYGSTLLPLQGSGWVSNSHIKSVTKVYGSTLLPLRGGWWMSNSQRKALQLCTVQRYYHYEGVGGCQIPRKKSLCNT